jgi:hypothetical protein
MIFGYLPEKLYEYIVEYKHFGRNRLSHECFEWINRYTELFQVFNDEIYDVKN